MLVLTEQDVGKVVDVRQKLTPAIGDKDFIGVVLSVGTHLYKISNMSKRTMEGQYQFTYVNKSDVHGYVKCKFPSDECTALTVVK